RSGQPDPRAGTEADPSIRFVSARERDGLRIFHRENCSRCHTLFDAPPSSGTVVPPAPFESWFMSRTGPDLGMEGHLHSDDWQFAHLYAPSAVVRGSRMPASRHLFTRSVSGPPVPSSDAIDLVAFLQALGRGRRDVWAEFRMTEPEIPAPPPVDTDLRDRGRALYSRHCSSCHGEEGDGRGEAADLLDTAPPDLRTGLYRFKSPQFAKAPEGTDLFRIITLGTGTGAAMPSFAGLPVIDRWALVLTVKAFAPTRQREGLEGIGVMDEPDPFSIPAGDPRAGIDPAAPARPDPLTAGRELWEALECHSCHDPFLREPRDLQGIGDQVGAGEIRHPGSLLHACDLRGGASVVALTHAFVVGIGLTMPSFGHALPDRSDRHALVEYLRARLIEDGDGFGGDPTPAAVRSGD
ncbi:MAG: c-type cytochrome, partial [Acidobacteria bacterium]|nr:c-type cytochrome [Acidobacteriota bacterium]